MPRFDLYFVQFYPDGTLSMNARYLFILLCATQITCTQAEIYKYTDPDGHVTYSSTPIKGAKKLDLDSEPTPQTPSRSSDLRGSNFPKVDSETQKNRDETRRKILEDELASEAKLLAEARQNLKDGMDKPEVYRGQDGKTYRNVAKYNEKISELESEVTLHEKNIDALRTELANLK
ncbi:MAG: DUF4124 domain-containing protein [Gallionellaceae bacterium]